jgi:hypothetical protein
MLNALINLLSTSLIAVDNFSPVITTGYSGMSADNGYYVNLPVDNSGRLSND